MKVIPLLILGVIALSAPLALVGYVMSGLVLGAMGFPGSDTLGVRGWAKDLAALWTGTPR